MCGADTGNKTARLVETIVRAMVDHPDEVSVEEVEGKYAVVLELTVHHDEIGKIIGKRGLTAQAIRKVLEAIGGKEQKRYILEILEPRRN